MFYFFVRPELALVNSCDLGCVALCACDSKPNRHYRPQDEKSQVQVVPICTKKLLCNLRLPCVQV